LLRSSAYFGQYGRVAKVAVNRRHVFTSGNQAGGSPTASAYITYNTRDAALNAIQAVDGTWLDGNIMRCAITENSKH